MNDKIFDIASEIAAEFKLGPSDLYDFNRVQGYEYVVYSLVEFFSSYILEFCGCGNPEFTYEIIRRYLNIRNDFHTDKIKYEDIKRKYKEELQLDPNDNTQYGILQFIMYTLDCRNITEHGSSVGGCWLTDLGKKYLAVLNAWRELEDKKDNEHI